MATLVIAYILGNYYYLLGFIYPDFIVDWVMDLYDPANQEEVADLEMIMNFVISFFTACVLAALFFIIRTIMKKNNR